MKKYSIVMGVEIHLELKTLTKMFSTSPLIYGALPNTAVNVADLAMPGTLPTLNGHAVSLSVLLAKALQMQIDPLLRFDRKNYYYSDLPKGYQITQQEFPLGQFGKIDVFVDGVSRVFSIERMHMEEDTAKQFHEEGATLIDFNRSGSPLLEIVSDPVFREANEVAAYIEGLRQLSVEMGVSDGKMNEGSMRCDLNISLRLNEDAPFGTKVEIKNLNSISNVTKAVEYEYERQAAMLDSGQKISMETRRFDESTGTTVGMRLKETITDYRYFTEPNLVPTLIGDDILGVSVPELPYARIVRYMKDFQMSFYDADVLGRTPVLVDYFEKVAGLTQSYKHLVNYLNQDVLSYLNEHPIDSFESLVTVSNFAKFIDEVAAGNISSKQAKTVFADMIEGLDPLASIEKHGMIQVSDDSVLIGYIESVLESNPKVIEDYRQGLDKSVKFVMGQVMKLSKGTVNPKRTNELVVLLLDKEL